MNINYGFYNIANKVFNTDSIEFFSTSTTHKVSDILSSQYDRFIQHINSGKILKAPNFKLSDQSIYVRFSSQPACITMVFSNQDYLTVINEFKCILKNSDNIILKNLRKLSKLSNIANSISVSHIGNAIIAVNGKITLSSSLMADNDLFGIKIPTDVLVKLAEKLAIYSKKNNYYIGYTDPVTTPIKFENEVYLVLTESQKYSNSFNQPIVFNSSSNILPSQSTVDKVLAKYKLIGGKV